MKRGKKPTRRQKELIGQQKIGNQFLNPNKWLVRQFTASKVLLIHKETGKTRELML
ncbi:DUF6906 family protein [Enterococcus plantarum]|uniref:DUF6906 family protein n=1 Tax=Enterococcus plantarum TaxID=1077675 RepID=UPI0015E88F81|nr:hypothetical protein [Enterococcus plantarum]